VNGAIAVQAPLAGPLELGVTNLLVATLLVVGSLALSRAWRIGVEVDLTWGAIRTVVQLLAVGYVLRWIFESELIWYVMLAFAVMLSAASWTASRRVRRPIPGLLGLSAVALAIGAGGTTLAVTALVVRADPWWDARYFLPLAGMIVGNAMNAAALAAERLQSEIIGRRDYIEELLALGATPRQAVAEPLRAAIRAGLLPTINAMLTVGLVALPGMMTGQMVAGADPQTAARYQIVVMFMLSAATTISALLLGAMLYKRFFTRAWQLDPDLLDTPSD
jgi:putative ABC transport system permease protein